MALFLMLPQRLFRVTIRRLEPPCARLRQLRRAPETRSFPIPRELADPLPVSEVAGKSRDHPILVGAGPSQAHAYSAVARRPVLGGLEGREIDVVDPAAHAEDVQRSGARERPSV